MCRHATRKKVAKAIKVMGASGVMRRQADEQGVVVMQDRMPEPGRNVAGTSRARVPPSITKMTNDQYNWATGEEAEEAPALHRRAEKAGAEAREGTGGAGRETSKSTRGGTGHRKGRDGSG